LSSPVNSGASGATTYSFGFAPDAAHAGQPFAPGQVYTTDTQLYNNGNTGGLYQVVTVPISQADYSTLLAFGQSGVAALGTPSFTASGVTFDMGYSGLGNSCVDFVWSALSTVGIPWPAHIPGTDLLPTWNAADEASALAGFVADGSQGVGKTVDTYNSDGEVTQSVTYSTTGSVLSTTQYSTSISDGTVSSSATIKNSAGEDIGSASITINDTSGAAKDNTSSTPTGSTQDLSTTSGSNITDTVTGPAPVELNDATITQAPVLPRDGVVTMTGNDDLVDVQTGAFGKLGSPYSAPDDVSGKGDTFTGEFVTANAEANGTSFTVDSSLDSIIDGDNYTGLTLTADGTPGGAGVSTQSITGVGTNSTVDVNLSSDDVTVTTGDTVNFGSGTHTELLDGSKDTVTEGNSSDASIDGTDDTIKLGSGDKILADGSGDDVVSSSNDTIDLESNQTVTITGTDDKIVGNTGDTIDLTGTSDKVYADSSDIDVTGSDTGDDVYGQGDTGDRSDWGGYYDQGGGYGGYGGGGYDAKGASKPSSLKGSTASSGIMRTGLADIAQIGATDQRLGMDRIDLTDGLIRPANSGSSILDAAWLDDEAAGNDPFPIQASATTPKPAGVRSPRGAVDQLIHAMSTWPPTAASSMFNFPNDTVDAASIPLLAKSSPEFHPTVNNHTQAA
jgi:hypothetical protein